ncbi:FAD-dependent oxidoreductase [bacterium]|nr:FAD-dependent oxidoreductase [bacterium]
MIEKKVDIAVIGAGPGGLAAAVSAKESGADVLLIERNPFLGGILIQCIHDGFGLHLFDKNYTGPEYAEEMVNRLENAGVPYLTNCMVIDLNEKKELTVVTSKGLMKLIAKAVILAMGCRERTRGALEIPGTRPAGIYTAGVAQNLVNIQNLRIGNDVVILGSGDVGLIMARRLKIEGLNVIRVIEILPYCSGLVRNRVQCLEDYGIPLTLSSTVIDIHGKDRLEAVTMAKVDRDFNVDHDTTEKIDCDTLLLSVGLIPENELSKKAGVNLDNRTSGALVDNFYETSTEGIFSCGNVLHIHDVADYASNEGFFVGEKAAEYAKGKWKHSGGKPVKIGNGISYVVPQYIRNDCNEVELKFRVTQPFENVRIIVKNGDDVVFKKRVLKVIPSEMNILKLKSIDPEKDVEVKIVIIDKNIN